MGNGCSLFKLNKVCIDGDMNISAEKDDLKSQNEEVKNLEYKNKKSKTQVEKQKSLGSNGIKHKNDGQENYSPLNAMQIHENDKNNQNSSKNNFTNLMEDLDFAFNNKDVEQNDLFNINYIKINTGYNKDIFFYLNKIRQEPKSIINDIDNLLKKRINFAENKIQIESDETHENIIFDDGGEALIETKNFLNKAKSIDIKFNLNEELLIDVSDIEKYVDLTLDKKIEKILREQKQNIISKYPKCQFFINFIKDKKIGLLYLLSQNEKMSKFRNIIYNNEYKEFNVSWMREKKKIFVAFLCFA